MEPDPSRRVEAYLDQVLAPLARRLSPFQRGELRRELREHLWERIASYRELGSSEDDAVTEALKQFGGAESFLREWRQEWTRTTPQATLREIGTATRTALLLSLPALLITCLGSPVWSHTIFLNQLAWAPAWMRYCWITHITAGWAGFGLDLILLPLAVGAGVGRLAPQQAAIGMLAALSVEIVLTDWYFLPTVLNFHGFMWPLSDQIFICSIFWLPLACTSAAISGWWTQKQRKRKVLA